MLLQTKIFTVFVSSMFSDIKEELFYIFITSIIIVSIIYSYSLYFKQTKKNI